MSGLNSRTSKDTSTKTKFGYTKPPSKLKSFIQGGGALGHIFSETIGKAASKSNLKRRQKFISKYNTNVPPSEKINLTDEKILSKDGLSALKGKGYTTISDRRVTGEKGNNNNNQSILEASAQVLPVNNVTAPTTAEISQATATNAAEPSASYSSGATLLANNKKGRKQTILKTASGLGDTNLNTTKKTLGA